MEKLAIAFAQELGSQTQKVNLTGYKGESRFSLSNIPDAIVRFVCGFM